MWYLRAMLHYADFHGRARRVEFWEFFGGWAILTMLALAADRMRVGPYEQGDNFIELAVTVAHLIPFCAVAARRSHDLNRYPSGEGRLVRVRVDDRDCAYGQPYAQPSA